MPSVTVIVRKAFGGAFIAMNSKALGADYVFAWPARGGGCDGRRAGRRYPLPPRDRRSRGPAAHRRRLALAYSAEQLQVDGASAEGFVDEVIAPEGTRARVASCLEALQDVHRPPSRASNIPL